MSSERSEQTTYMLSHTVSEQSPMRSNYLTFYKARKSRSGHKMSKSPDDLQNHRYEKRALTKNCRGSNVHRIGVRRSGSDLCFEDLQKRRNRDSITTALSDYVRDGERFDYSCNSASNSHSTFTSRGVSMFVGSEKSNEPKYNLSLKKKTVHETSEPETWTKRNNNSSLCSKNNTVSETHKNGTHFERMCEERNGTGELSGATYDDTPSKRLFFMKEDRGKLFNHEGKVDNIELTERKQRRSYIDKTRNILGFKTKAALRRHCEIPEQCSGSFERFIKSGERTNGRTVEQDNESYASYIGDHCRKNRRCRNANQKPEVAVHNQLEIHRNVKNNLDAEVAYGKQETRKLTSCDIRGLADVPIVISNRRRNGLRKIEYGINKEGYGANSQESLSLTSRTGSNRATAEKSYQEEELTIAGKQRRHRRRFGNSDVLSIISSSDDNSAPRRMRRRRKRSAPKESEVSILSSRDKGLGINLRDARATNTRRTGKSEKVNLQSHVDNESVDIHRRQQSGKMIGPETLASLITDDILINPPWTCTRWADEVCKDVTEEPTICHWAYEAYSHTCLPADGAKINNSNNMWVDDDEDASPGYDTAKTKAKYDTEVKKRVNCSNKLNGYGSVHPQKLFDDGCEFESMQAAKIKPHLVANVGGLKVGEMKCDISNDFQNNWPLYLDSEQFGNHREHIQTYQQNRRSELTDTCTHISDAAFHSDLSRSRHTNEIYRDSTHMLSQSDSKESCRSSVRNDEECAELSGIGQQNACDPIKCEDSSGPDDSFIQPQSSADANLIRTVHSIKDDIQSVFERLSSMDVPKDQGILKTALSIKESVMDVLDQARNFGSRSTVSNVAGVAEAVKNAFKNLASFNPAFAADSVGDEDYNNLTYELYKIGKDEYNARTEMVKSEYNVNIVPVEATRHRFTKMKMNDETTIVNNETTNVNDHATKVNDHSIEASDYTTIVKDIIKRDIDERGTICVGNTPPPEICSKNSKENVSDLLRGKGEEDIKWESRSTSRHVITQEEDEFDKQSVKSRRKFKLSETTKICTTSELSHLLDRSSEKLRLQKLQENFPKLIADKDASGVPISVTRLALSEKEPKKCKRKASPKNTKRSPKITGKEPYQMMVADRDENVKKKTIRKTRSNSSLRSVVSHKVISDKKKPDFLAPRAVDTAEKTAKKLQGSDTTEDVSPTSLLLKPEFSPCAPSEKSSKTTSSSATQDLKEDITQVYEYKIIETEDEEEEDTLVDIRDPYLITKTVKKKRRTNKYPLTARDVKIVYTIKSTTSVPEAEAAIINSYRLRETQEEIISLGIPLDVKQGIPTSKPHEDPQSNNSKGEGIEIDPQDDRICINKYGLGEKESERVNHPANEILLAPVPEFASPGSDVASVEKLEVASQIKKGLFPNSTNIDSSTLSSSDSEVFQTPKKKKKKKNGKGKRLRAQHDFYTPELRIRLSAPDQDFLVDGERILRAANARIKASKDAPEVQLDIIFTDKELDQIERSLRIREKQVPNSKEREVASEKQPTASVDTSQTKDILPGVEAARSSPKESEKEITVTKEEPRKELLNEQQEKQATATNNEKSNEIKDVVDGINVSQLQTSIMNLYEEITKLRMHLATTADDECSRTPPTQRKKKHEKSHNRAGKKRGIKDTSPKEKLSRSSSSLSTTSSLRKSLLTSDSETDNKSAPYYWEKPCIKRLLQKKCEEEKAKKVLSPAYQEQTRSEICCVYRKYGFSPPEDPSLYFVDSKQLPVDEPACYQELLPQEVSYHEVEYFQEEDLDLPQLLGREGAAEIDEDLGNAYTEYNPQVSDQAEFYEDTDAQIDEEESLEMDNTEQFGSAELVDDDLHTTVLSEGNVVYTSNTFTTCNLGLFEIPASCSGINTGGGIEDGINSQNMLQNDGISSDSKFWTHDYIHNQDVGNGGAASGRKSHLETVLNISRENLAKQQGFNCAAGGDSPFMKDKVFEAKQVEPAREIDVYDVYFALDTKLKIFSPPPANPSTNDDIKPNPTKETQHTQNASVDGEEVASDKNGVEDPTVTKNDAAKEQDDYFSQSHIPRFVQCVKEMLFGSTKANSSQAADKTAQATDSLASARSTAKSKHLDSSKFKQRVGSRIQQGDGDTDEIVCDGYVNARRKCPRASKVNTYDSEMISSPVVQNYIFKKRETRKSHGSHTSAKEPQNIQKSGAGYGTGRNNEEDAVSMRDELPVWGFREKDLLLTCQTLKPQLSKLAGDASSVLKNVEETDKTIPHYSDAISTSSSKRSIAQDTQSLGVPKAFNSPDFCSLRTFPVDCGKRKDYIGSDKEERGSFPWERSSDSESAELHERKESTRSFQDVECISDLDSSICSASLGTMFGENSAPLSEGLLPQTRHCYVEDCRFRQRKEENSSEENIRDGARTMLKDNSVTNDDKVLPKHAAVCGSAGHTSEENSNKGSTPSMKEKVDSVADLVAFARELQDKHVCYIFHDVRSVDYDRNGEKRHYNHDTRSEKAKDDDDVVEDEAEESKTGTTYEDDGADNFSDDDNLGHEASSDDTCMDDDERESWYKTTDDESNV